MTKSVSWWMGLASVTIIAAFIFFWHLGRTPLTNWDEGIYSDVALTMHQGGSWWLPSYHGTLFLEKPPLTFWLMNLSFNWFGVGELAVRWWSALAGLLTTLLITVWTKQLTKKVRLGILAGLLFVSGRFLFFHAFRTGDTDGLLVFFITASLYSYWRTKTDQRWWWGVGLATGLAIMTKSFVGLLPQVIIDADLLISGGWRTISWRRAMEGLGLLLLVAVPWHLAVALHHGADLWHQVIGFNLIERSSSTIASLNEPWYWYGQVMLNFFFPTSVVAGLAALTAIRRWGKNVRAERLFLLWMLIIFFAFAFAQTKYDHYIQPLYPALAILIAIMIDQLWSSRNRWVAAILSLTAAIMALLLPRRLAHNGLLWWLTPYGWLPDQWSHGGLKFVVSVVSVGAIGGVLWLLARWQKWSMVSMWLGGLVAYVLMLSFGWQYSYLKHLPTTSTAKNFAADIVRFHPAQVQVTFSHQSEPAAYFYLDRALPGQVTETTGAPSSQFVIDKNSGPVPIGYTTAIDDPGYRLYSRL